MKKKTSGLWMLLMALGLVGCASVRKDQRMQPESTGGRGWLWMPFWLCLLVACTPARKAQSVAEPLSAKGTVVPERRQLPPEQRARLAYFYQEAFKHKQAERHSAAYELYRHCLEIDPESPEALYETGVYLLYLRREDEAVGMLAKAVELEPDNIWFKEALASYYIEKRDVEHAIPVLEDLAALSTKRTDVLSQLVTMYVNAGQYADAVRALDRIEVLDGKTEQVSLEKYRLYMEMKEEKKAFRELEQLAEEFPNDLSYRVLIGNQYLRQDKPEKALAVFEEVRQQEPANPTLQMALLDYYEQMKDETAYALLRDSLLYGENTDVGVRAALLRDLIVQKNTSPEGKAQIEGIFSRILQGKQKSIDMLALYAAYLTNEKASPDSIAGVMKRVLEVEPDNRTALFQLLQYYGSRKENGALADICRQGINYYPDQLMFYFYLGFACYQNDQLDEALEALENGARQVDGTVDRTVVSDLYSMMGDMYYKKGREAEAFAAYDSCLVYKDDNVSCLNNYAYYLSLRNQDLDKAEEMSYRTIKAEPNNRTYLDTYAWILFIKERYTEARLYIDKVLAPAAPGEEEEISGVLLEHAGDIYYKCGEKEKALDFWRKARKAGEASPLLDSKIKLKKYVE